MHRFFSTSPLGHILTITENMPLFHQLMHVFRARVDDEIVLFIEGGADTVFSVIEISRKMLRLEKKTELPLRILKNSPVHVFHGFPNKIATMEIIVQKMVEIGIQHLTFFSSDHTQLTSIPKNKQWRLTSIAHEAMEQSGQNMPIVINYSNKKIAELLWEYASLQNFIASQDGSRALPKLTESMGLWIWPEGGWSIDEAQFFRQRGELLWAFNEHILRLETAGIVGAGILSYLGQI